MELYTRTLLTSDRSKGGFEGLPAAGRPLRELEAESPIPGPRGLALGTRRPRSAAAARATRDPQRILDFHRSGRLRPRRSPRLLRWGLVPRGGPGRPGRAGRRVGRMEARRRDHD